MKYAQLTYTLRRGFLYVDQKPIEDPKARLHLSLWFISSFINLIKDHDMDIEARFKIDGNTLVLVSAFSEE